MRILVLAVCVLALGLAFVAGHRAGLVAELAPPVIG